MISWMVGSPALGISAGGTLRAGTTPTTTPCTLDEDAVEGVESVLGTAPLVLGGSAWNASSGTRGPMAPKTARTAVVRAAASAEGLAPGNVAWGEEGTDGAVMEEEEEGRSPGGRFAVVDVDEEEEEEEPKAEDDVSTDAQKFSLLDPSVVPSPSLSIPRLIFSPSTRSP